MRRPHTPPRIAARPFVVSVAALCLTALVFFVLPLTQQFSREPRLVRQVVSPWSPPPPPPPPQSVAPPAERREGQRPILREPRTPLEVNRIDLTLEPGTGGAIEGEFAVISFETLDGLGQDLGITIFKPEEVESQPESTRTVEPKYPRKLQVAKVSATVSVVFYVDEQGDVHDAKLYRGGSPYPELNEACLEAIRLFKFKPGIKEGRPVKVYGYWEFPFRPR